MREGKKIGHTSLNEARQEAFLLQKLKSNLISTFSLRVGFSSLSSELDCSSLFGTFLHELTEDLNLDPLNLHQPLPLMLKKVINFFV